MGQSIHSVLQRGFRLHFKLHSGSAVQRICKKCRRMHWNQELLSKHSSCSFTSSLKCVRPCTVIWWLTILRVMLSQYGRRFQTRTDQPGEMCDPKQLQKSLRWPPLKKHCKHGKGCLTWHIYTQTGHTSKTSPSYRLASYICETSPIGVSCRLAYGGCDMCSQGPPTVQTAGGSDGSQWQWGLLRQPVKQG